MSISKKTKADIVCASIKKYLNTRGIQPHKNQISINELASMEVVERETSIRNLIAYSADKIDHETVETQYTNFKVWISESADHYKPELAQLLYPLFTHLYIRLLQVAGSGGPSSVAHRFHKRHLSTFQGNPEFKQFISQLGESSSVEELEQNPTINSFIAARYCVTLTNKTYTHLLRYLETSQCNLILNILNQKVDITVGDWLGAGSRQDTRANLIAAETALASPDLTATAITTRQTLDESAAAAEKDDVDRFNDLARSVRGGSPTAPSVTLYRVQSKEEVCVSARTDNMCKLLLAGCEDSQVRLWHLLPNETPIVIDASSASVRLGCDRQVTSTGGDEIGSSEAISAARVRMVEAGKARTLRGHTGTVYDAVFLPEDRLIVSVSEDTTVRLWERETGANVSVQHGHVYPIWCVASDCLGVNYVTGGMDRTARLWRPEMAHPLRVYAGHEQDVDCVSFHPNCQYIMTGSCDRTVRMWSVTDGRCVRVFNGHKGAVSNVQVSPCGRIAASAGEDKKIRVWDLAQGKPIKELKGHTDTVTNLTWADSRMLCSAGMDGSIRVWDVGIGENENLEFYPVGGTVLGINFTETNTLVAMSQDPGQGMPTN